MDERTALVGVVGMSPAVVTETLYALAVERRIEIGGLHLIGTAASRETVASFLDGKKGALARLRAAYPDARAPAAYTFHCLKRDGCELDDIRSGADNDAAAQQIARIVRDLVDEGDVLHGSIAGGRKTMGSYLTIGFELWARPADRLYHVLASREAEADKSFAFPEGERQFRVELAEIPFIRLRSFVESDRKLGAKSLDRIMSFLQAQLDETRKIPRLKFITRKGGVSVQVDDVAVELKRTSEAKMWLDAARRRKKCVAQGAPDCACCFVSPAEYGKNFASARSSIERTLRDIAGSAAWLHLVALMPVGKKKRGGGVRYGIALPPEKIDLSRLAEDSIRVDE